MRGGKRPGAGRKVGTATKKTREIANSVGANGITPLEVMINTMRLAWKQSEDEGHAGEHIHMAISCAEKAAPYIHARIPGHHPWRIRRRQAHRQADHRMG